MDLNSDSNTPGVSRTLTTVEITPGIPSSDPLAWLPANPENAWFWEIPSEETSWVGLGAIMSFEFTGEDRFIQAGAAAQEVFDQINLIAPNEAPAPRLAAGFAFDDKLYDRTWTDFGVGRLVLPAIQILRNRDRTWLTTVETESTNRPSVPAPAPLVPEVVDPNDWSNPSEREHYRQLVRIALTAIGNGKLKKAVPCRSMSVAQQADSVLLLATLRSQYPSCVTFQVPGGPHKFIGSTPERLAAVRAGHLHTAALAGSAARHHQHAVDLALGQGLLTSPKERFEHEMVVDAICRTLTLLGLDPHHPEEAQLFRLQGIQHLYTPIHSELPVNRGLLEVVDALHPTPAVSGDPADLASTLREKYEGIDRGWFAGPVGWLDAHGNGEFRVALRSGLLRDSGALLYAGAGVVAGSDPDRELLETDTKLRAMLGPIIAASESI